MSTHRYSYFGLLVLAATLGATACGDDDDSGNAGTGGSSANTGGMNGTGGVKNTGGVNGTGGAKVTTGGRKGTGEAGGAGEAGQGGAGQAGAGGASQAGQAGAGEAGQGGAGGGSGRLDPGGRVIDIEPARFFPEGVTVDKNGNFYVGSMDLGSIYTATANGGKAESFIEPDAENELVSVIGLYADDATDTLWVCSSDAGNSSRAGKAGAAIKAFSLPTGKFLASYDWPAFSGDPLPEASTQGVTGFCNDLTVDADGNLYATDSWYPRIVRLRSGAAELEEWLVSDAFPQDQWHLNGIDVDQTTNTLYVVENHPGALYSIPIEANGSPGAVTAIETSRALLSPDGLKVLAPNLLVTAEGGNEGGGVAYVWLHGARGTVEEVIQGFDQVATFALHQGSAWVVENQGDHFWGPADNGPDAEPPFRLVEVPLAVGAGGAIIETSAPDFFPEGVTLDADDNFYIGSMNTGAIHRAAANATESESFIEPDDTNKLVSVLGLYAHDTSNTLWVCSSDAGNGQLAGTAPAALKAFDLTSGALKGSWDWPVFATPLPVADTQGVAGFCNDITVDDAGNVYATDSWYPRILRLPAGATNTTLLEEWVTSNVFPADQWHLNGIDIDRTNGVLYAVENHPGALYSIPILPNGKSGVVKQVVTSRPLYSPDGLKVLSAGVLAIAEGQPGGMAVIEITGNNGYVRRVSTGLDGIATFAVRKGSAWLVENQGDHFWGMAPDPVKPFRLVEVPLNQP